MKKLALSLVAASLAATSFAHDGKGNNALHMGNILLYGVGSYSNTHGTTTSKYATANSSTVDQPRILNWEVSPGIGYSITDNLTVGVDGRYMGSKTTYDRKSLGSPTLANPAVDQVKTFEYAVGPFVRYSWSLGDRFFAYGQATAHYLRGRETTRLVTATTGGSSFVHDDDYKGLDATFVPAVGIMVCHTMGITFGIGGVGYTYQKYDNSTYNLPAGSESSSKNNEFVVTLGRQFNIGVQKYFGCGMMRHHRTGGEDEMMDRSMDTSDDSNDNDGGKKRKRNDDE